QFSGPGDHLEEPRRGDRTTALGVEHVAALQIVSPHLAERPDFAAGERVRAGEAALGAPDMDAAAVELDHVPGQRAKLAGAQAVAIGEEDGGSVPVTVARVRRTAS